MPALRRTTARWLLIIWLLAAPPLALSLARGEAVRVDIGAWGDAAMLRGFNGPEQAASEDYRWTTGSAAVELPALSPAYTILSLRAHGWRPDGPSPQLRLGVAGRPWATLQVAPGMRIYRTLVPADLSRPTVPLTLETEAFHPPGDERVVGVAVDWVELARPAGLAPPGPWQLGGELLLLALGLAAAARTSACAREGRGPHLAAAVGAALAAALIAANLAEPLWVALALPAWLPLAALMLLAAGLSGPALTRWLAPWLGGRGAALALALVWGGLALRLLGAGHPFFEAHDLPVHDRWMHAVVGGSLYLYSTPGELANRLTFNPPAGYLLLLPLWLAADLKLTIQLGTALADGLGCLLLLGVARELGAGRRAALLALALYVALPINMTMLWWGFAANDMAQTLWLLLLWLLLREARAPSRAGPALVGLAAALCATTHVGALVLVAAMLATLAAAAVWRLPAASWRPLAAALGAVGLALLVVYFSAAAAPVLAQPPDPRARTLAQTLARGLEMRDVRLTLVGGAWSLGFTMPLLAAVPPGLLLLWGARARHALQRALVGGWVGVSALFFAVYMALGLLTRYIYFDAPLACLAGGALLAGLGRTRAGRVVAVALALFVLAAGVALWVGGVLLRDKPSLVPLTH